MHPLWPQQYILHCRQTETDRVKCYGRSLETSSRVNYSNITLNSPPIISSVKFQNIQRLKPFHKLVVVVPQRSLVAVQSIAEQVASTFGRSCLIKRFIGSRRGRFLSQHLSTRKVATEGELCSLLTAHNASWSYHKNTQKSEYKYRSKNGHSLVMDKSLLYICQRYQRVRLLTD